MTTTAAWTNDILADAETSTRLTPWEIEFCDDLRGRMLTSHGCYPISDKQTAVLERIEIKLYQT